MFFTEQINVDDDNDDIFPNSARNAELDLAYLSSPVTIDLD